MRRGQTGETRPYALVQRSEDGSARQKERKPWVWPNKETLESFGCLSSKGKLRFPVRSMTSLGTVKWAVGGWGGGGGRGVGGQCRVWEGVSYFKPDSSQTPSTAQTQRQHFLNRYDWRGSVWHEFSSFKPQWLKRNFTLFYYYFFCIAVIENPHQTGWRRVLLAGDGAVSPHNELKTKQKNSKRRRERERERETKREREREKTILRDIRSFHVFLSF